MKNYLAVFFVLSVVLSPSAQAMNVQEVTGPKSGVKAWLVEDRRLPIVALQFSFEGGIEQDPEDKQGLEALTVEALTEGAGKYDSAAFQQKLADRSITLGFEAGRDEITGGLKCLAEDKEEAFELLRLALASPRFDEEAIKRLKAQQLSGIRRQFSDPNWQGRNALLSEIYKGHPYSQRRLGTAQTLAAIGRGDIKDFAVRHLARDTLIVAAAGAITPAELAAALDKIFGGLPERATLRTIPEVSLKESGPTILVPRDGTQTELLFALPGPKRSDPSFYAAQIVNYTLGGGRFASRLMKRVRDEKGLTYGISTALSPSERAALVVGDAAVDNEKAGESLKLVRETMRRLYKEGLTAQEIKAAKDYLTGSMPLELTSTDKIAGFLAYMQREKLGRDYAERYSDIVRGVSEKEIAEVLERFFNPDKMTLVLVGRPKGIAPTYVKETVKE